MEEAEVVSFQVAGDGTESQDATVPWYKRAMEALKNLTLKAVEKVKAFFKWNVECFNSMILLGPVECTAVVSYFTVLGGFFGMLVASELPTFLWLNVLSYTAAGIAIGLLFSMVCIYAVGVFARTLVWYRERVVFNKV